MAGLCVFRGVLLTALWLTASATSPAEEPPAIPVGLDAYRQWDRWPQQRIGARAYMRSTYDRRGGNEGADASHFLYQLADDFNVTLDVAGPGVLYFVRCNHWHGSPWHYEVDGVDHMVQESSTADPNHPVENSVFLPQNLFPEPLAWTWSTTKGADLNWVPVPFGQGFRLGYSRTRYGTGYYIYHLYDRSARLSHPLESWDGKTAPAKDVMLLISQAGSDIAPREDTAEGKALGVIRVGGGPISLRKDSAVQVKKISTGRPTMLRALEFSVPRDEAIEFGRCRVRVTWDDRAKPSIDAPVALFFGAGTLYHRDNREYLVKAFPVSVRFEPSRDQRRANSKVGQASRLPAAPRVSTAVWAGETPALHSAHSGAMAQGATVPADRTRDHKEARGTKNTASASARVHLACYFPMPFFRSAKIELVGNGTTNLSGIEWNVRYHPLKSPPNHVAYFHATYRDHFDPEPGQDLVLLDTGQVEGGGEWSGSFVGTSWIFSHRAALNTLEGDPRFFFDDSRTPQAYGTGTEEWGGGGDYWGGRNMTLPFAGHPTGARSESEAQNEEDKIESAYRFLLADLMPFGKRAVIRLEHGGENQSREHYETLTYWYGVNAPTLVKTDELKIGDAESEKSHRYVSPQASEPYEITSRYEWGVDTLGGKEIYPAETDRGRKTDGQSEFGLKLSPDNYGVLLRRKLDYALPNQRAEVSVADGSVSDEKAEWKPAGVWYLAGANTCVYSNPKEELGATQHIVQASNRRFRDDEFIVPRELTRGRKSIRVRVKFTPVRTPLFPGQPVAELAWSEIRYDAYCWVMPPAPAL